MDSASISASTPGSAGAAVSRIGTAPGRGCGPRRRRPKNEVWRCRCGAEGMIKIVHESGRGRVYCLECWELP